LQSAFVLGLLAHALNGIHHIALLRKESVSQIGGPLNFVCQPFHELWQSSESLDARIPRLFCHRIGQFFVLQSFVLLQPPLEQNYFEGIS
jgi:hypothetical protein